MNIIEAQACFEGPQHELHNRVAELEGAFWYDLTDDGRRAVKVTPDGWELVQKPPILFVRYEHHQPQVEPVSGGDITRLFDFLSPMDEQTKLLLLVWMVSCFIENTPHPVPVLHGPQGAGKSYAFRILRRTIDPSILLALSLPNNNNGLVQTLSHHWVALFDNVDILQPWQSDLMCRAVTGEGFSKRQLYTDDEDYIYSFRRCLGLNGINIAATRADLLDRSILIGLERIDPTQRRSEKELESAFFKARPHILGGVLDALSKAMTIMPTIELAARPRMADFAAWGCAIAEALGYSSGDFIAAYDANIQSQNSEVLEGHPVATAIMTLMEEQTTWQGEPAALLETLETIAEEQRINTHAKIWPKAPNALTRRINEVKTNLKEAGLTIERSRTGDGKRKIWTFEKNPENTVGIVGTDGRAPKLLKNNDQIPDDTSVDIATISEIPSGLSTGSKSLKNNISGDTVGSDDNNGLLHGNEPASDDDWEEVII